MQIGVHVFSEDSKIGLIPTINEHRLIGTDPFVVFIDHLLPVFYKGLDKLNFLEPLNIFRSEEFYRILFYIDGTFYSSSIRLLHSAPVLKRIRDQTIGRNGSVSVVPVLYSNGSQSYFSNESVCAKLAKGDPVANANRIIYRNLYAGDKSQDGIFKYQQHHRRNCT